MDTELNHIYFEPLTHREMVVLKLLAEGLSNQEIAAKLVVQVSTVKWYNAQIFGKLQVKNRKQAVIRARNLGILATDSHNLFQKPHHNLPVHTLPFIGRKHEIQKLVQHLTDDETRLITILGAGGMGKSRLAIEVSQQLLAHFRDGVYFISLASVASITQVVTTIAAALDFKFHSDYQTQQQLLQYLQPRQLLLIVDNFEHLLDSAGLLTDILEAAPKIKILVTSREKLELSGELTYIIGGLSTPTEEDTDGVEHDAVKLYIEAANRTSSPVQDAEIGAVIRICQMLGGMPLAILLAAAWLDTLSLAEIETELKNGLAILESSFRDVPARHRSIATVFDYSWKRLTEYEQLIFMRLSVFRGGFSREAAKAVTGASIRDLQRLVHTSFIQHTPSGRYNIHELLRQYGASKLQASEEMNTISEKHAQYFAEFITPLGLSPWESVNQELLDSVVADYENIHAAWEFQLIQRNIAGLQQFLAGLWMFFDQLTRNVEAVILFENALKVFEDAGDEAELLRAQLLLRLSWFTDAIGQKEKGQQMGRQALPILEAYHANDDILLALLGLAASLSFTGQHQEALEINLKGIDLARKIGGTRWQTILENQHALYYVGLGQYQEALVWMESLPETHRLTGTMGMILSHLGEYAQAEVYLLQQLQQVTRHRWSYISTYCDLIEIAVRTQNLERAWFYLHQALHAIGDVSNAWMALHIFGFAIDILMSEEQYERSVELLALIQNHPATMESTGHRVQKHHDLLKNTLSLTQFETAWQRGKSLDWESVIEELLAHED